MDIRVNDLPGVQQANQVNQTQNTDDTFKFTLNSALADADLHPMRRKTVVITRRP